MAENRANPGPPSFNSRKIIPKLRSPFNRPHRSLSLSPQHIPLKNKLYFWKNKAETPIVYRHTDFVIGSYSYLPELPAP